MPRHRKERITRHKALPAGQRPERRAPDSASSAVPEIGSETAAEIDGTLEQNDTTPLLAVGSTPEPAPVSRPRRVQARRLRSHAVATGVSRSRRMRGLLVTPWFAAGAGFVIAAGLALNSPHTTLTYRPDTKPCAGNCTTGQARGSMPAASPGVQIKTASPAPAGSGSHGHGPATRHGQPGGQHHGGTGSAGPAGAGVGYKILFRRLGHFSLLITVPPAQAGHEWSLQFQIPGAQITRVWGAQWQPSGHDGGVATMLGRQPGTDGQRPPAGPGSRRWRRHHGWSPSDGGFLVIGQGSPGTPTGCVLNHAACHFDHG
jgi:hypothetical protein